MAGIDQITKEILDEASKNADKLISDAYATAENIKAKAQEGVPCFPKSTTISSGSGAS